MPALSNSSAYPAASRALVVGESITDVVVRDGQTVDHAGGSPLNVSFGVARLGLAATFVSDIGDDARGKALRDHLVNAGVDIQLPLVAGRRSATATTTIDELGGAHYDFAIEWALPFEEVNDVPATIAHFGSIGAFLAPGANATELVIARARAHAVVTYDPNIRPQLLAAPAETRPLVERHLALSDLAKASEEDIAWLYPGVSPAHAAEQWLKAGPSVVVITLGGDGALIATASGVRLTVPAIRTTLVDTIGAGDSFTAALITALALYKLDGPTGREALARIDEGTVRAIAERAVRTGAITVSRAGAMPPTEAELRGWSFEN